MSELIARRSFITAALTLPAVTTLAQTAPAQGSTAQRPLFMPNKTKLYQRIITHPGAALSPGPNPTGAQNIAGFEVFYVYQRPGNGWVQVGRDSDGHIDGWVPEAKTIDWRSTLVGAFTNPSGRQPVLFLRGKESEQDLILDSHADDTAQRLLTEAEAGRPGPVIAHEKPGWANIDDHFYLLPILSATPIEREFGPSPLQLLEVVSAPEETPPAQQHEFRAAVVFLVDTTVSMQPWIDATRDIIRQVVTRIRSTPFGDSFRFGLVAYRDSLEDGVGLEYPTKVYAKPDFSQPADAIMPAIAQVNQAHYPSNGYDEDPIGGLKATLDEIDWNNISPGFRHVILITDAAARPGNHPHSLTRMGITDIKASVDRAEVWVWALHLLTQEGDRLHDFPLAARQYKELTDLNAKVQRYYPVGHPPQYATRADFFEEADKLAHNLIKVVSDTSGRPVADWRADRPAQSPQETQQWRVLAEAMRLAYYGHENLTTAPEAVRSWTTDRDLKDPALSSIGIRVLLTKNQLSDLADGLKKILREGRAGQTAPDNFFTRLQQTVVSAFRDPNQIHNAQQVGSLLGEFLDDLPYKSKLLKITDHEWRNMSGNDRDAILDSIEDRLAFYQYCDGQHDKWYDLGHSHNPNEAVYPVPLAALP